MTCKPCFWPTVISLAKERILTAAFYIGCHLLRYKNVNLERRKLKLISQKLISTRGMKLITILFHSVWLCHKLNAQEDPANCSRVFKKLSSLILSLWTNKRAIWSRLFNLSWKFKNQFCTIIVINIEYESKEQKQSDSHICETFLHHQFFLFPRGEEEEDERKIPPS